MSFHNEATLFVQYRQFLNVSGFEISKFLRALRTADVYQRLSVTRAKNNVDELPEVSFFKFRYFSNL